MSAHASHDVIPGWAGLVIYVAGFVVATRVYFATDDEGDRAEARFNAACVGLIWPIALAGIILWGLVTLPTLGARTKSDRQQRAAAAEQERRALALRIGELEAENERLRGGSS